MTGAAAARARGPCRGGMTGCHAFPCSYLALPFVREQERRAGGLDDGSGRIRPELVPLADSLLAMDNPLSGLTWLYRRRDRTGSASDLLRRLARGEAELTHEGLRARQPWRAAAHLRDLLTGLRRSPRHRQADLRVRAVARRPPRWHRRRRPLHA